MKKGDPAPDATSPSRTRPTDDRTPGPGGDVTRLLSAIDDGDPHAASELLPLVYSELRKLAASRMTRERPGQTLQATALVHEAYLRLVDVDRPQQWNGRAHFFAAAAEAMRRILVERARRGRRLRHGGGRRRIDLDQVASAAAPVQPRAAEDLLALDQALTRLEADAPDAAAIVKLRYFAGLTMADTATAAGVSVRTANRHWAYARAWLYQQLGGDGDGSGETKR